MTGPWGGDTQLFPVGIPQFIPIGFQVAWSEKVASSIIENLRKRRMEGSYAPSAARARDEVLAMIPRGAAVYRCASITTASVGLWERLAELPGVKVIDDYRPGAGCTRYEPAGERA